MAKQVKYPQPAQVSRFFGPGWQRLGLFIKKLWEKNLDSVQKYHKNSKSHGLLSIKGMAWFAGAMSMMVFGTISFAAISVAISLVLTTFFILVYIGYSLIWIVDRIYLHRNKIFASCDYCKEKSLIPIYECPDCGARHTNLTPGKYGIFHRTCRCGKKLGCTFFTGRKEYPAYCRQCGEPLNAKESRPICIPIIGGRSVGKTAYITAFSRQFISEVAPDHAWDVEFYDEKSEKLYNEIKTDYRTGSTRLTVRSMDINQPSTTSFTFFLKGKPFNPDRLVHIYDIAGEVFTSNNESEVQKQYDYCHGIILMIDPFSIPNVRFRYEGELQEADIAGIGTADISGIIDVFFNKMREVCGLSADAMSKTPVAVVVSKADTPGLKRALGPAAVAEMKKRLLAADPNQKYSDADIQDLVCRQFFIDNDMEGLISNIDMKFKETRYFSCSAIGHTREQGEFRPRGVLEPMEWLMRKADPAIDKNWTDNSFGKVPIKTEV